MVSSGPSVQSITTAQLIRTLKEEGPTKITWLIGAGFSVSSGIPLALEMSDLITTYAWLISDQQSAPWDNGRSVQHWDQASLDRYLDWRDSALREFTELLKDANRWLYSQPRFSMDDPSTTRYSLLFEEFLRLPDTRQRFLSSLVHRARGPNLAHMALAQVLQDCAEWGQTVFTTNFDDLLLQSLMALGHTGRIFGDLNPTDKPESHPAYPQVVHLHGRHCMYFMRNRSDELAAQNDQLEEAFRDHIRESNLVVIGYSGWDDTASRVLRDWPSHTFLIRGNVYWVPFRSRDTMESRILDLLAQAPAGRAYIVEDPANDLDADLFMLRLLKVWMEDPKDAVARFQIRQIRLMELLDEQLTHYPEFDPGRAERLCEETRLAIGRNDYATATALAQEARNAAQAQGQRDSEARASLLMGQASWYQDDLGAAREAYDGALALFQAVGSRLGEANTRKALGDLYRYQADLGAAREAYDGALALFQAVGSRLGEANTLTEMTEMAVSEGNLKHARMLARMAGPLAEATSNRYALEKLGRLELWPRRRGRGRGPRTV